MALTSDHSIVFAYRKLPLSGMSGEHSAITYGKLSRIKGYVSLRKSKVGFLNPKESENGFRVPLLNRSMQDLSNRSASKEPENPLPEWILRLP